MKLSINNALNSLTQVAGNLFNPARKVDYKTLSSYILRINQVSTLEGILEEASLCLQEILGYQMFAFAVEANGELAIWVDPALYRNAVEGIIDRDFSRMSGSSPLKKRYINPTQGEGDRQLPFETSALISYNMGDENYTARLYLSPEKPVKSYHGDIVNIIVRTISNALSNMMNIQRLKNDVALDPLTGCYNRRELERQLESHFAHAKRYDKPLSVIMFDIDHFKRVNDTYGHQAGDEVLKEIARVVKSEIRDCDILARYGGEEFLVILPETSRREAVSLAERLRTRVRNMTVRTSGEKIKVTSSFGVSSMAKGKERCQLVSEADAMLYQAKSKGRDMVMPGAIRLFTPNAGKLGTRELLPV